jgi:hypothetical protein
MVWTLDLTLDRLSTFRKNPVRAMTDLYEAGLRASGTPYLSGSWA